MKLDLDCIRDILLTVEEQTGYNQFMTYSLLNTKYDLLKKYDNAKVIYHIKQCEKSNLIESEQLDLAGNILVKDLTPKGHEFIANIRNNSNWGKVKKIVNKTGAKTIDGVMEIAKNVISEVIALALKNGK